MRLSKNPPGEAESTGEVGGGSVKKNEDFSIFSVDLIQIAGFMLN